MIRASHYASNAACNCARTRVLSLSLSFASENFYAPARRNATHDFSVETTRTNDADSSSRFPGQRARKANFVMADRTRVPCSSAFRKEILTQTRRLDFAPAANANGFKNRERVAASRANALRVFREIPEVAAGSVRDSLEPKTAACYTNSSRYVNTCCRVLYRRQ